MNLTWYLALPHGLFCLCFLQNRWIRSRLLHSEEWRDPEKVSLVVNGYNSPHRWADLKPFSPLTLVCRQFYCFRNPFEQRVPPFSCMSWHSWIRRVQKNYPVFIVFPSIQGRRRTALLDRSAVVTQTASKLNHLYGVKAWRSWVQQRNKQLRERESLF